MRVETIFTGKRGAGLCVLEAKTNAHSLVGGVECFEVRQDIRRRALYLHFDRTVFHIAYPAGECVCLCEIGVGKAKADALDLALPPKKIALRGVLSGRVAYQHRKPAPQFELNAGRF